MEIATIGFTGTTAESFFERVRNSNLQRVADVRAHNTSQLAGFAKRDDLKYFLRELCSAEYFELPELAPEADLLAAYRGKQVSWEGYAESYVALLKHRAVERAVDRTWLDPGVILLCSEASPDQCHRRLAAEYLQSAWGDVTICHL